MTEQQLSKCRDDIAVLIKKKRVEKGYTQKQLADKVGIERITIFRAEKSQYWLGLKQFISICKVLDIDFDSIFE